MESYPSTFQGFKVVILKQTSEKNEGHHLLWKRHSVRVYSDLKPPARTLFVVNVPPYCTEDTFKILFKKYGEVENVYFQKNPSAASVEMPKHPDFTNWSPVEGFKVAYVVFKNQAAIKRAMNPSSKEELVLPTKDQQIVTGMQKWCQEYNKQFINPEVLGAEIKLIMESYDKEKESQKRGITETEPDEDGWVTVSSKKKKPRLLKANELKGKKGKKKKKTELVKFYAFQQRQEKIDDLATLRKNFEEDKKRINVMKASRKFKP